MVLKIHDLPIFHAATRTLKTKSWSRLVKVSHTWSQGQIGHKYTFDQPRPTSTNILLRVKIRKSISYKEAKRVISA